MRRIPSVASLLSFFVLPVLPACAPHAEPPRAPLPTSTASAPPPAHQDPETLAIRYADGSRASMMPPDPARKEKLKQLVPKLDALFAKSMEENHGPGLGVAIVLDGEIVYAKGLGYRSLETKAPFEVDSPFRVASVTKGFTAMAILKLRDEGRLRLDEPAARYYPALARLAYPTRDSPLITVRDLLTHGSGLPEDNYWVDAAGEVSEEKLLALLESGMTFSRAPGTSFEYSNTGYALLGKVIEGVTGIPARDYIRKEILLPLGMTHSGFRPEELGQDRLVLGYRGEDGYHGTDTVQRVAPMDPLGVYEVAGGLHASLGDMARYMVFQLSAWPPRDDVETGPIRRSSVREMQQGARRGDPNSFPRTLLPSRRPAVVRAGGSEPTLFSFSYGFGLFATTTCEESFDVHHDGALPGFSTRLSLLPTRGFGIVTFFNDERVKSDPTDEATQILRDAGVIDVLARAPVPALDAARAEVEKLLSSWDAGRAKGLFDPTFWHYQPEEKLQEQLGELTKAHGACRTEGKLEVNNLTRGRWRMNCEHGEITFVAVLSPEAKPRLQTLLWEASLPPDAPLTRAAETVAGWVHRWDAAAAKKLLAPSVDLAQTQKTMARLGIDRGACTVERALSSDGSTKATFRLGCTEGAVEISLTRDPKTERITRVRSALPRKLMNCAQ